MAAGQVVIRATVEVFFRLSETAFDSKAEERRTQFNGIISHWSRKGDAKPSEKDLETMQELARHKFIPAEFMIGRWKIEGDVLAKDEVEGLARVQHAASKNYGPAIYFIGKSHMQGDLLHRDREKVLLSFVTPLFLAVGRLNTPWA